jgi:hypothetical protein
LSYLSKVSFKNVIALVGKEDPLGDGQCQKCLLGKYCERVLVSWGCCNQVAETKWLKQHKRILLSFGGHKYKIKVVAMLTPPEARNQKQICSMPVLVRLLIAVKIPETI